MLKSATHDLDFARLLAKPWTPHEGQKLGVQFLVSHQHGAVFADPGVGKTSITLSAFKVLKAKGLVKKMLIVAPLRPCYLVWPKEIVKWKEFSDLRMVVLHGSAMTDRLNEDADIFVINPEGLEKLLGTEKRVTFSGKKKVVVDPLFFQMYGFDVLCVDELSKFKHHNSNRSQALRSVLGTFSRRWGLTGTPVGNGLMDLFGQMLIIDQGASLGKYITHFQANYFVKDWDGFTYIPRPQSEEVIYQKIAPYVVRLAAEDYIDMPEINYNDIEVDLPTPARKAYREVEKEFITEISDKLVTAANAASAGNKCRQVCNGAAYVDDRLQRIIDGHTEGPIKRSVVDIHGVKLDALDELVSELQGSPLLVAYEFNHDIARLLKRFPNTPYMGKGVSMDECLSLEKRWNNGDLPLLFGQPQSIGHGLNLQEKGHHVAWFGVTFDWELYDQFNRRVWRQGNAAKKVYVHHIICRHTIEDRVVLPLLRAKAKGQASLFAALKRFAEEGVE
jgi:SNF2 family DNA or RNA helicase